MRCGIRRKVVPSKDEGTCGKLRGRSRSPSLQAIAPAPELAQCEESREQNTHYTDMPMHRTQMQSEWVLT